MPEGAVYVGRPSRFGNPFPVDRDSPFSPDVAVRMYRDVLLTGETWFHGHRFAYPMPSVETIRAELTGRDLGCWCPLDQPCHADVLLELANRGQVAPLVPHG